MTHWLLFALQFKSNLFLFLCSNRDPTSNLFVVEMHLTAQTNVFVSEQNFFLVDEKTPTVNCVLVPLQLLQGFTPHPHVGLLAASDEDVGG